MAKATVKTAEVEVRQYAGAGSFTVMNDLKGELHAKKGDWLVGTEKGKIDVLTDVEFREKYDLTEDLTDKDQEPTPIVFSPLVDPVPGAAPHKGIVEPTGSATRDSQPAPGFIDESSVPLSDKTTPVKTPTPSTPLPAVGAASGTTASVAVPAAGVSDEIVVPKGGTVQQEDGSISTLEKLTSPKLTNGRVIRSIDPGADSDVVKLEPVGSTVAASGSVPVSAAASAAVVGASDKVTGSVIELEGTEKLTVKSDSTLKLAKGSTVPVDEAFPGAVLAGGWVIEHVEHDDDETILTLKKQ